MGLEMGQVEFWPIWLTNVISLGVGLIVGSFLNVLIVRLPLGQPIVWSRSLCPKCKKPIPWHDNIPVLSYLMLLGKCRSCRDSISIRYPVIELLTAITFLAMRVRLDWGILLFLRDWPCAAILIAIAFIDLEHRIIPDALSLGGLALGLLSSIWVPGLGFLSSLLGAGVGFCVFYLMAWAYERWSGRMGLGGGDIKLLAMLGSFIGVSGVFSVILVSSVLGSLVGMGIAFFGRNRDWRSIAIPYGPFLVVAGLFYYLWSDALWFRYTIPI